MNWLLRMLRGFGHAFAGLAWALRSQRNMKVHAVATLLVVALGLADNLARWEWCAVAFSIALVWVAELLNSALEELCNRVTLEQDPLIRKVKDMAAGAVLVAAAQAVFVAFLVFA